MKKLMVCSMIATVLIASVSFVIPVFAAPAGGECGDGVNWTFAETTGKLTIRGNGAMKDYPYASSSYNLVPWYDYTKDVKEIEIAEGVTHIGDYAFANMSNAVKVSIPDSVTSFGTGAFYRCANLHGLRIPSGTTQLNGSVFYGCKQLKSVTIPEGVTSIPGRVFGGCSILTEVKIDGPITSIGVDAFAGCGNLTAIELPKTLKKIWDKAFYNTGLSSITLPEGLESMGIEVFYSCDNLKSVTVPYTVTDLWQTFSGATALKFIKFEGDCPQMGWELFGGVEAIVQYPGNNPTWHEELRTDSGGVITWVSYESDRPVPEIRDSGKYGENVTWKLTGDYTLIISGEGPMEDYPVNAAPWKDDARWIRRVVIEDGVTTIGRYAFRDCTNLQEVVIPESLISIHTGCFYHCLELESVIIPQNVTKIELGAFSSALKYIYFLGDVPSMDSMVFREAKLTAVYPAGNGTWTEEVKQNYGGVVEWLEDCGENHTEKKLPAVAATCDEAGWTEGTQCTRCHWILLEQEKVPVKCHNLVQDAPQSATCTKDGLTEGCHCSKCKAVFVAQQKINAKGHHYVIWKTIKEATVEEEGLQERQCATCGDTKIVTLPKLATPTTVPTTQPTQQTTATTNQTEPTTTEPTSVPASTPTTSSSVSVPVTTDNAVQIDPLVEADVKAIAIMLLAIAGISLATMGILIYVKLTKKDEEE